MVRVRGRSLVHGLAARPRPRRTTLAIIDDDLDTARRLLPEGTWLDAPFRRFLPAGTVGIGVDLPHGLFGFVDILMLPRDPNRWPQTGEPGRFEVLQHRHGQARLWPLLEQHRAKPWHSAGQEQWRQRAARHPVGSRLVGTIEATFASNREYIVRVADPLGDWTATLAWTGQPPLVGTTGDYEVTGLLPETQRIQLRPMPPK